MSAVLDCLTSSPPVPFLCLCPCPFWCEGFCFLGGLSEVIPNPPNVDRLLLLAIDTSAECRVSHPSTNVSGIQGSECGSSCSNAHNGISMSTVLPNGSGTWLLISHEWTSCLLNDEMPKSAGSKATSPLKEKDCTWIACTTKLLLGLDSASTSFFSLL